MEPADQTPDELLQTADQSFQDRRIEEALQEYQAALKAARSEFNRPVEVEALSQIARMLLILGKMEDGRTYLDEAAARANTEDIMGWSRYMGVKGRFEWKSNQLSVARFTFAEMYEFCTTNELWSRGIDAANMMAIVSEDSVVQLEWSRRGIDLAEFNGVDSWLGPLWNNLGTTLFDQKNYQEALEAFTKARDFHWRHSNEVAKLVADYHVGMTYRFLRDYDTAGKWLRPVLAWAERIDNHNIIAQALEDLGECDIAQGNPARGISLLLRAREEYALDGAEERSPDMWQALNNRIKGLQSRT
jgi:tetratricopeptide (TPR) repeat protein